MPYEDEDLLEELIIESVEHLTSIEPDLLEMENNDAQVSSELINRVFRAMHSIKGGFAFFGLNHIVDLSHAMENVLMRVRDGEATVTPETTDALLAGVDKLRTLLDDVQGSESISIDEVLAPLNAILESQASETEDADPPLPEPMSEPEEATSEAEVEPEVAAADPEEPDVEAEPDEGLASAPPALELVKPEVETVQPAAKAESTTSEPKGESIRVKVDLLDKLMNLAGELVLGRNQIKLALSSRFSEAASASSSYKRLHDELERTQESILTQIHEASAALASGGSVAQQQLRAAIGREFARIQDALNQVMSVRLVETPGMAAMMQDVDLVTSELQSSIMNTRMQPVGSVFAKFPRIMRDLSRKMGKEIELELIGQDVELDKSIIEALADPLTHLVRNSADHGIESPDARESKGKPRQGSVRLRAYHEGGQVNIDITDDGAGVDPEKLKRKAIDRGIITEEASEKMNDREALRLIFAPGFSTAEVVSDVSGRGVGMDVVKTNIEKLGGTVEIESVLGESTRINLRLPLTLAIIPSLIVGASGRRYAVPQVNLEELVRVREQDVSKRIEEVRGKLVLRLRGTLLPLVRLTDVLATAPGPELTGEELEPEEEPEDRRNGITGQDRSRRAQNILVLRIGSNRYGLIVEKLLDNEEIVVKPLSGYLKECKHYAGSTIMGDGRVAMILDAAGISDVAELRFSEMEEEATRTAQLRTTESEAQPLILFRNSGSELFAISLALVERIEKVKVKDIERVGDREYVKYSRSSMRIIRLHDFITVDRPEQDQDEIFIIVPKLVQHPMGIVATKVEDIVHTDAEIDRANISGQGILGSAILDGRLVVFLDVYGLFETVDRELYGAADQSAVQTLAGKRILLAEDTAFFRTIQTEYLRAFGCQVDAVINGAEALTKLDEQSYDALVTDILMPEVDGFELIERVRASTRHASLPIIAVTSLHNKEAAARAEEIGVDAYEMKLDKDRLYKALARVIEKRQGEQPWSANTQPSTSEKHASASIS